MLFKNTLIAVADIDKSVKFYNDIFGLQVKTDFGANKTLTGGIVLQTQETFTDFIDNKKIFFGGNSFELYFEEEDFDSFVNKLKNYKIDYVHSVKEHSWGQRVVRLYDPDKHIIEIGEKMENVCKRFASMGMTNKEIAKRMDTPLDYVNNCMKNY